jgi:hypothetical protein
MVERSYSPSRRRVIKGAVAGMVAANFATVAVADQADAALLAMGRELAALAAQEQAADAASDRLHEAAKRSCPAPSATLLAYAYQGEPLFRSLGDGYTLNTGPYGYLLKRWRLCDSLGTVADRWPEVSLMADLKTWEDGLRAAGEANGYAAAMREMERAAQAAHALCGRIAVMPATTPAGVLVKLQALAYCHRGEPGDGTEWIAETINNVPIYGRGFSIDERLVYSVFRDACAILASGAPA